MNKYI